MKVAIISNVDIKHMSLISMYTKYFNENNIEFDIINASESIDPDSLDKSNIYTFRHNTNRNKNRLLNKINNINYVNFVKTKLSNTHYDYLIIWRSEVGFLLQNILTKSYKHKYFLNIRDYAGELNKRYFNKQVKLVENSKVNVISSKGFLKFLPEGNYIYRHSINESLKDLIIKGEANCFAEEPIKIGFIGNVRFFEEDKKLLNSLKNDKRFIVQYFGTGSSKLREFSKANEINNTEFIDQFDINETPALLRKTDIINNIYGNTNIAVETLVSIRYYYSLLSKKPFIANANTYMGALTLKNKIGFEFDGNYESLGDNLYAWYLNLDFDTYFKQTNMELEKIEKDNDAFNKSLFSTFK